jgi:diguanylate cyclase (GGDEF)-like protein
MADRPSRPLLTQLWTPPDRALTDAGTAGEALLARLRLGLIGLVLVMPTLGLLTEPARRDHQIGIVGGAAAFAVALGVFALTRRGFHAPWLGFATSILDVTLISATQIALIGIGAPDIIVNSRVMFPLYLLALAAACLRYDARVVAVAGLAALVQYLGLLAICVATWPGDPLTTSPTGFGAVIVSDQVGRVLILIGMTVTCSAIVVRTQDLRFQSTHDALTTLYNRPYFDERIDEELLRARRYRRPLTVALVDLDHFKAVNDVFGHGDGDAVLRGIAQFLRDGVRRTDIVARYGGEEFAVVLPEADPHEAVAKLDRLRGDLARMTFPLPHAARDLTVTCSIGVAHWPIDGDDVGQLLRVADERLLEAKRHGRNRVVATDRV